MSKNTLINLNQLITDMIHRPRINGFPLYKRVDESEQNEGKEFTAESRGEKWVKASNKAYNSPGNIRRIFITHKRVIVHYFAPVFGDKNKSLSRQANFPIDMEQVLISLMRGENKYRVKGTGLYAIYKPWVCSNVEEVYFDWTLLMSEEVNNMGFGNLINYYNTIEKVGMMDGTPIKEIFKNECLRGVDGLRNRFTRLRCIGLISNLEEIYDIIGKSEDRENDKFKLWVNNKYVIESVRNPQYSVSLVKFDDVGKYNSEMSIKDGIYQYDKDVLSRYAEKMNKTIKETRGKLREEIKGTEEKQNELEGAIKVDKSEFEIHLDEIYLAKGPTYTKIAFTVATEGLSKESKIAIIEEFSTEGKEKYSNILNRQG